MWSFNRSTGSSAWGWASISIGSAEFLGPNEEKGWELAGKAVPVLYILWSLWLVAAGVALLRR